LFDGVLDSNLNNAVELQLRVLEYRLAFPFSARVSSSSPASIPFKAADVQSEV
jgi:hypothetical protein